MTPDAAKHRTMKKNYPAWQDERAHLNAWIAELRYNLALARAALWNYIKTEVEAPGPGPRPIVMRKPR